MFVVNYNFLIRACEVIGLHLKCHLEESVDDCDDDGWWWEMTDRRTDRQTDKRLQFSRWDVQPNSGLHLALKTKFNSKQCTTTQREASDELKIFTFIALYSFLLLTFTHNISSMTFNGICRIKPPDNYSVFLFNLKKTNIAKHIILYN